MTRSKLIINLAKRFPGLPKEDISEAMEVILSAITRQLSEGGRAEVRGFGRFVMNHQDERIGRNPKTGEQMTIPPKALPHFKAGKALREAVNTQWRATDVGQP